MGLIASLCHRSGKGVVAGSAIHQVASDGSLTGKEPHTWGLGCRRAAQTRHRRPVNHQRQRHGLLRCAATCATHGSIMLFLDSASLSSWEAFSSTRMFTGMPRLAALTAAESAAVTVCLQVTSPNDKGLTTGITTNPTILQRDGLECSVHSLQRFAATVSLQHGEHMVTHLLLPDGRAVHVLCVTQPRAQHAPTCRHSNAERLRFSCRRGATIWQLAGS